MLTRKRLKDGHQNRTVGEHWEYSGLTEFKMLSADPAKVEQLVAMGIDSTVAENALALTKNDVEQAANYIFTGEPISIEDDTDVQVVEHRSLTAVPVQTTVNEIPEDILSGHPHLLDIPSESWKPLEEGEFLTILPLPPSSILESYLSLFALCVAVNVPLKFLGIDFEHWPYNKHWYKGELLTSDYRLVHRDSGPKIISRHELSAKELLEPQPGLIPRLQRLIAVTNDPDSKRRFISAKLINKGVDPHLFHVLSQSDHLYEIFPQFIKNLHSDMDMCLSDGQTNKVFLSKALHRSSFDEPFQPTSLTVLNFSPENYAPSLYQMFNPLLLPERSSNGYQLENAFDHLAPVFTIMFDDMDETSEDVNLSHGVEVPIEFYPQLYLKETLLKVVIPLQERVDELKASNQEILNKMTSLQSFQGKQISSFLNSSVKFISEDVLGESAGAKQLVAQLNLVKESLSHKKKELMQAYSKNQQEVAQLSMDNPQLAIEKSKQYQLIDEPYLLRLAVLSPYDYLVSHRDGTWTRHRSDIHATTIRSDSLLELEVQDIIKYNTRHASETPILFVYIKQNAIDDQEAVSEALKGNLAIQSFLSEEHKFYENNFFE